MAEDSSLLVSYGLHCVEAGEYERALNSFDEALTHGVYGAPFYNRAFLLFYLERYSQVVELLTDPLPDLLHDVDRKRLLLLREECGRRVSAGCRGSAQEEVYGLFNRAMEAHKAGLTRESVELFGNVLDIDPLHYIAWNNRAHALMELGDHEHAFVCVLIALALRKYRSLAWCTLGEILARLDFKREALSCFEESFRLDDSEKRADYIAAQIALLETSRLHDLR